MQNKNLNRTIRSVSVGRDYGEREGEISVFKQGDQGKPFYYYDFGA